MKPFFKWAGNKFQIIDRIKASLPKGKRLIEPFLGSGAVFLNTNYNNYYLSDLNQDLIQLYQYLKSEGQEFINDCKSYFSPKHNNETLFYELRDLFNSTRDRRLKSVLFLYLNKHCFNGLCRYNSKGEFNTPFGKYKKPYFPEKEMQFFYEKAKQATFQRADFLTTLQIAEPGDVVYCDPPYVPLSKTANFTSYSAGGFDESQQILLAEMAEKLAAKGITVIISNHDTALTQRIYRKSKISCFEVQRYISRDGNNRSKAAEVLAIFN